MSHSAVFVYEDTNDAGTVSTGKGAIMGRFVYRNKDTLLNHGSRHAFMYLAQVILSELYKVEGRFEELTKSQLEVIRAQQQQFEKTDNESVQLVDIQFMSA